MALQVWAVDGPSGSGKTVFADALVARLHGEGRDVALVRADDFATWDAPASWWPRLATGVLRPLGQGRPGGYRRVEWRRPSEHAPAVPRPGAWVDVPVPEVLVLEGVTTARRAMAGRLDRAFWVQWGDEATRLERAVARDGEACRAHLERWQRFERGWFAVDDTRSRCERAES
ncbi:uridine kinase [Tomitella gaofuii]|uniref:uridine kinase family protein n=1 Tax=Tomitella gaofuii TaxID=2760083 RepID=UPI002E280A95|nr:uridine kinase [Tomitella gaofuii]